MRFLKKVRLELIVFAVIVGAISFLLPREALIGLLSLLASKVLTLTIGVLLAHLLRIVAFHYLDLSDMIEKHHSAGVVFLAIWYAVIIYAVAVGG
jgi:hypothetical protein